MKVWRVVVPSIAVVLLATGLWVVGGNAWATRREERCDLAWTATFGSLDDLKKKYPKREANETAKHLEELARGTVFDLTPVVGSIGPEDMGLGAEWNRSQETVDFLLAQIAKPEASIDPPPENVIRFLEEKRVILDAIESILAAGPPPQWALDLSVPENDRRKPNALGQIRLQRILTARALIAAHGGHDDAAARALEASWNLNESLRGRPETLSTLLSIAIARFQVGILRKVNVEEDVWGRQLATLAPKTSLLDAFDVGHRTGSWRIWRSAAFEQDREDSWLRRARYLFAGPWFRLEWAHYSEVMRAEFARSKSAPLSDHYSEPPTRKGWSLASVSSIAIPNIRNAFVRADRLVVDTELTSKILEAKHLRRENGRRWPAAIPGIEASRYPGASWRYEVSHDGSRMSITFSRELASPYPSNAKPLPLRFSSN